MPVESRDDMVKRLREKITSGHSRGCQGREYTCDCGYDISIEGFLELAATRIEFDAKRIAELERKHFDADDKRCYWQNRAETAERALAEERERCALLADDYLCPDNQTEDYSSGFIDACIFIATAIRSGKPDGKE